MEHFVAIVNVLEPLNIVAKYFILDVFKSCEYASDFSPNLVKSNVKRPIFSKRIADDYGAELFHA